MNVSQASSITQLLLSALVAPSLLSTSFQSQVTFQWMYPGYFKENLKSLPIGSDSPYSQGFYSSDKTPQLRKTSGKKRFMQAYNSQVTIHHSTKSKHEPKTGTWRQGTGAKSHRGSGCWLVFMIQDHQTRGVVPSVVIWTLPNQSLIW